MAQYESLGSNRHIAAFRDGIPEIRIPARRNWFLLAFLLFWLTLWTGGGIMAMVQLVTNFEFFLIFWLFGWAFGWCFAAGTIAWQLTGCEVIRTVQGDLDIGWRMMALARSKLYRGADIRSLSPSSAPVFPFGNMRWDYPPFLPAQWGSMKFGYGAKTVYFGRGVDEAEAQAIVADLKSRLPLAARSE